MSTHHPQPERRRVRFQDRAFANGNFVGVNAYRVNLSAFRQLMVEGGYGVEETAHFLLGRREDAPTVVVHWFAPEMVDSNLGRYFLEELKPMGIVTQPWDFGAVFAVVIGSLFPRDPERGWHLYSTNTLHRYAQLMADPHPNSADYASPVAVFSTLYRRVCALLIGGSLLDAGCSSGFLPLIVAEHVPALSAILGVDIRPEPFAVGRAIAGERGLAHVQFAQADLLAADLPTIGHFDTVTILHVLEHFSEADMYRVLENLLQITTRRLIIAVPYESGEPEAVYGHEQLFTRARLEAVGQWCLTQWGGGQMQCEDCAGGLLYIDRPTPSRPIDVSFEHKQGDAMHHHGGQQRQQEGGGDPPAFEQRGDDEKEDDKGK